MGNFTKTESDLYLPDTNIVIHYVRDDRVKQYVESQYSLLVSEKIPLTNCAVEVEVRSIALLNKWGVAKSDQMRFFLSTFRRVSIEHEDVMDAYVAIDHFSRSKGVTMGKNDLWIAATASVTDATILTTDKDFDHLDPGFLTRILIDPSV